ncbi:MAG: 1-acyl-sn-glycerol-3-phosphate acyltransferase [Sphingomonas sp.]|jgi:1-acyl-sn-glycerol-3-phosphate acyltransferase|uniref:lysophospholipid acyltransferase family protein n=1 Tax=Sphingomonas sp. CD22 TaxID=3100214 RepID=UPI0012110BE5|nr:lysophospholipid acyltransferase family protein [Sphingomonas sp. CD22]MEA1083428.1 lysophospholipid acyltransferase family protein [Sphingomonas sp. CD22]RZL54850.1 MAG: 1-acyl-sn-glycerol-3-phosphate acyltransferase [Sphingomonas sp.]
MNRLRTILFATFFYILSVPIVMSVPVSALFGRRAVIRHAHVWARMHRLLYRYIMGVRVRVEGQVPAGTYFFAAKHQAMFETLELQLLLGDPAMVIKRELSRIPFWGWAAMRYGGIIADREASAGALRSMMRAAKALKAEGRSILIYPEGTRVAPGEQPPLQSGFAGLYRALALPVVPVALDTGLVWPKHGPKRPGVVTIRIGETIPPGLPREAIEARVHDAINVLDRERRDYRMVQAPPAA